MGVEYHSCNVGGEKSIVYKITGSPEERKADLENMEKNLSSALSGSELLTLRTHNDKNHDTIYFSKKSPFDSISKNVHGLAPGQLLGESLNPMNDYNTRLNASIEYGDYLGGAYHHLNNLP